MINPGLNLTFWRTQLQQKGRTQVADYLQPEAAERLRQCLAEEVPWTLALRDARGARTLDHAAYGALTEEEAQRLFADTASSARDPADDGFRFVYDTYMMVRAYQEGRDPGLLLHRVLELFNSPDYLAFARHLTGDGRIRRINAQATRYRRGQFLRRHNDDERNEGRLYAYVLNLSRDWEADWGGLLQFIGDDRRVQDTFLPAWNTLSVFAVPTGHAVSLVAPWAGDDRLAITGWMLT